METVLGQVTNAKNALLNAVASEGRSVAEVKINVIRHKSAKKCLASHRQGVCATGRRTGQLELTPLDEQLAGIIRESLLSDVVMEVEGDTGVGPINSHSVLL